jgi:serine/threonine protein kinase
MWYRHLRSLAVSPHAADLSGITLSGRYRLRAVLGTGGFGTVYEASDDRLERMVAVKVVHPWWAQDPEWTDRFVQEARLAASLGHRGIVVVHDTGEDETHGLYIVYELIDGESLAARAARTTISPEQAGLICADVLDALHAAHVRGIVYRDVGPQNVLLASDDTTKITDFGVARLSTGMTRSSASATVVGRPVYMSPEQSRGRQVGPGSDVYSVGVVLFELLAGHPPFDGESFVEIAMKHNADEVPALPISVPGELALVTRRALAKEPGDRYSSAAAMAAALRTVVGEDLATERLGSGSARAKRSMPPPAHEETTILLPRKPHRRRWAAALAVLTLGAVAVGIVITSGPRDSGKPAAGPASTSTSTPVNTALPADVAAPPAQRVRVPRLVGLGQRDASRHARATKLELAAISASSSRTARGHVIDQKPREGKRIPAGSTVTVRVSTGPAPVDVPDVGHQSLVSAEGQLTDTSLHSTVLLVPNHGAPPGTVLSQNPSPGTPVPPGTSVTLSVARAPSWHPVTTLDLSSDGSSARFRITGAQWRVRYDLTFGQCQFQCFGPSLYVNGTYGLLQNYQMGAGSHETEIPEPPGTYSIQVTAISQDPFSLHLVVEQYF